MKLVFATHNAHKLEEVRLLLPQKIELLSLRDIGCLEEIPETASTLEGNAKLKAQHVYGRYHYPCFADDTGLLVDALNGAPGVFSARYAGIHHNAQANMDKLLEQMRDTSLRMAQFVTVIALVTSEGTVIFKGEVHGQITEHRQGDGGFGYDPLFRPDGYERTFAQMETSEKNRLSHRGKALKKLIAHLEITTD